VIVRVRDALVVVVIHRGVSVSVMIFGEWIDEWIQINSSRLSLTTTDDE
jgi:uncharacterized protein (DUF58 family)